MESTGANVSLFSGMRLLPDELLGRSTVRHFPFKSARVIVVNVSVFVKAKKQSRLFCSGVYLIYLVVSYVPSGKCFTHENCHILSI